VLPLALVAAFLISPAAGVGKTLTFGPVADTIIRADKPTRSYGSATTIGADNSPIQHSLLRFTVAGVGTDVVTAATVRLFVTNASPVGGSVYRVASQSWSENVTWATAPAADPGALATTAKATVNTWMTFNVLPLVRGDGTYSVRLTSTSSDGVDYTSREGSATQRPQLVVTTAPPPDSTPPTVSISAPIDGSQVAGQVPVNATASDANGVASVSFAVDSSPLGTDATAPYGVTWDSTTVPNGPHVLTATARDPAGNAATSAAIAVTVANDTTPPDVVITAPPTDATAVGPVSMSATASDASGVASVSFRVDGQTVATDTTDPYTATWDSTTVSNGQHILTARAVDTIGNARVSDAVSVTVANAVDTTPPSPPGNLRATADGPTKVTLTWDPSTDDTSVATYEVRRDGTLIASPKNPGYVDEAASAGSSIRYAVVAVDPAGNRSDPSTADTNTPAIPTSFTFAAAGDHGANTKTAAGLGALDASPAAFYLALGDMDYDETATDAAWCDYVHQNLPTKGASFPFELVAGNHEDDSGPNGRILNFAACLPDHAGSTPGPGSQYGAEYSFDYPASAPLARVIMISPELTVAGHTYHYTPGTTDYAWLSNTIDQAHTAGIPWVIVGMHFPCLTAGNYQCAANPALMNLLVQKRVDLVLHGHEHSYQRSKQVALDPTTCPSIAATGYNPACVADDGIDGIYPEGAGTVDVIAGTFGRGLYNVSRSDPEAPYFAKLDGASHGFMQYTVTAKRIDASFVKTDGSLNDAFSIVSGATATADRALPSQPTNVAADTSTPGRVKLTWSSSTDNAAIGSYSVFRDSVYVGSATTTSFSDPSVSSGQTYTYTVVAYDTAFNPSQTSSPVSVTVPAATTMTFNADADASIYAASPSTNYGSSTRLETDNSPIKNFLIRFTVTGTGTGTVTNARLRLTCADPSPRGGDFTVAASNDWTENTVTWGSAPAAGTTIASLGAVASGSTYEVDVSSMIHGDGTYTLRITSPNADGADFTSREGTLAARPLLTVTVGTPSAPPNDVQPSFPIEAAFYYPWYPESWTQSGVSPFTDYHPSLGYYDTSAVAATHVQQMSDAHIEAGIASWWGPGSTTDGRIPTLLNAASGTPFRWALYYELESTSDPPVAQLDAALDYIAAAYGSNPTYLRVNGKPVLFVYADDNDGCEMATRWAEANAGRFYLSLKVFSGYAACSSQPNTWHQYAPAVAETDMAPYAITISPGFDLYGEAPRLQRDAARWSANVRNLYASSDPWHLIATFNEWGEGTAIESATEWGTTYLDAVASRGT
jgi:fibronectin type 3 domain-containing protein